MSEHTKGKLEYRIVAANSIDIISKEDESSIVVSIISDENDNDELTVLEIANAKRLVKCWNCHDSLAPACEEIAKADKDKIGNLQWDELICVISDMIQIAKAALAKVKKE